MRERNVVDLLTQSGLANLPTLVLGLGQVSIANSLVTGGVSWYSHLLIVRSPLPKCDLQRESTYHSLRRGGRVDYNPAGIHPHDFDVRPGRARADASRGCDVADAASGCFLAYSCVCRGTRDCGHPTGSRELLRATCVAPSILRTVTGDSVTTTPPPSVPALSAASLIALTLALVAAGLLPMRHQTVA